ncbi:M20 family metallopeptidase [Agrilactobacillus yilanensis]|uniref:M20 family metallopeptidase n=1 Tax=Agrilactobacillus yilanensis TaxID=2485997 RepID=A0ABW4J542_9LACO|nr:M20 family metallopeptidase [Agrilactobacillus yilanensis]
MDEVTQLTSQLVKIDSSDPGAYEGEIADFISHWLQDNAPAAMVEKQEVLPNRYNVRAVLKGETPHPALVYICHMDTVVLGDDWQRSTPLAGEIIGQRLYGRGACDMKSGLACAMSAFAAMAQRVAAGETLKHDFVLITSADEEDYMRGVEKAIDAQWVNAQDLVLDGEPTNGEIRVAHKGRTWITLDVQGVTAHASTPEKGIDAIAAIAQLITKTKAAIQKFPAHPKLGKSTITFGMIQGGYRPYVVPDKAKVWIDMRLVPPLNTAEVLDIFKTIIAQTKTDFPGLKVDMVIDGDRPPIEEDPNSPLLAAITETVAEVTGKPAVVGVFTGYTDTAVIAGKLHNPNCMSYGPGDLELAHKPDEYVNLEDITRCHHVMVQLAEKVLL